MEGKETGRTRRSGAPGWLPGLLLAAAVVPALAATPGDAAAQAPGEGDGAAAVKAVVTELFDAMRAGDSAAAARLFAPGARLERPVEGESGTELRVVPVDAFLGSIAGAGPGRLDEMIWDVEVRVDGKLATAWMPYLFYLDGALHHCGVNAFRLYRTAGGWKIFGIADTSRTEGCPDPPEDAS